MVNAKNCNPEANILIRLNWSKRLPIALSKAWAVLNASWNFAKAMLAYVFKTSLIFVVLAATECADNVDSEIATTFAR